MNAGVSRARTDECRGIQDAAIARCVARARAEYIEAGKAFKQDSTRQDAAILNVMRACESAVDLANMLVRAHKLGVPKDMKGSFALLAGGKIITGELSMRLQKMIGFRNIAVRQYQDLDLDIVEAVIRDGLDDLLAFAEAVQPHLAALG